MHAQYVQAVHQALTVARAEPVEWHTYDHDDGALRISCLFRFYDREPMRDDRVPLAADPDAWHGYGFELRWTEGCGWS
ncbi:hypothetical protein TR51_00055 [Kitasatospora griseola]|uniref:Uncharacterized protein n=1 Tax=Kitasatospora griseola TaxID=2064 RepID=A0A0D0PUE2_KITGR|nr:hypothetical protein [Kitasatospora griseola]KIQ66144.1 hypothetical protein TR51_00055 [Kitasatospora griseola]